MKKTTEITLSDLIQRGTSCYQYNSIDSAVSFKAELTLSGFWEYERYFFDVLTFKFSANTFGSIYVDLTGFIDGVGLAVKTNYVLHAKTKCKKQVITMDELTDLITDLSMCDYGLLASTEMESAFKDYLKIVAPEYVDTVVGGGVNRYYFNIFNNLIVDL